MNFGYPKIENLPVKYSAFDVFCQKVFIIRLMVNQF